MRTLMLLGYQFVRFPDLMREVAIPWARTDPILGCAIAVLVGLTCARAVARPSRPHLLSASARAVHLSPARRERKSPAAPRDALRIFSLPPGDPYLSHDDCRRRARHGGRFALYGPRDCALCLGGFALTEDFQPEHLWNIDTAAVNFRVGLSEWQVRHYHPRSDMRGAGEWLHGHIAAGHDLVVSSFPGLDFYYAQEDSFFMEPTDPRYEEWACDEGARERWGNRPLVSSLSGLAALVYPGRTVWLVIEPQRAALLAVRLAKTAPTVHLNTEWTAVGHDLAIVALRRS